MQQGTRRQGEGIIQIFNSDPRGGDNVADWEEGNSTLCESGKNATNDEVWVKNGQEPPNGNLTKSWVKACQYLFRLRRYVERLGRRLPVFWMLTPTHIA